MWREPSISSPALPVLGKARVQSQPQPLGEDCTAVPGKDGELSQHKSSSLF